MTRPQRGQFSTDSYWSWSAAMRRANRLAATHGVRFSVRRARWSSTPLYVVFRSEL